MTNKVMSLIPIIQMADSLLKDVHTAFEKDLLKNIQRNCMIQTEHFPVSDTYVHYVNSDKKVIEKVSLKLYLAGYKKEDIEVQINENDKTLIISGQVKDNEHFPVGDNIQRLTQKASAKKFRVDYNINKYEVSNVNMSEGVLTVDLIPVKDSSFKRLDIN